MSSISFAHWGLFDRGEIIQEVNLLALLPQWKLALDHWRGWNDGKYCSLVRELFSPLLGTEQLTKLLPASVTNNSTGKEEFTLPTSSKPHPQAHWLQGGVIP